MPPRRTLAARLLAEGLRQADFAAPEGLGRYELLRPLGAGASSEVFLARDPILDRQVAIKVLRGIGWNQERFLREMRVLASLDHEGIVRIHDAGVVGGRPFYVMDHVGTRSLADAALPLREAVAVVEAAARACQAAHERGIVHRDLKPENIVLGQRPVVVDFGVAKVLDDPHLTRPGRLLGTPYYMAPEQFRGGPVDARTDVYALGVILYLAATGRLPFDGDDLGALSEQVCAGGPARPSTLDPGVPVDLEDVMLRAMARDPGARHPTALALADELRRWLEALPRANTPTSDAPPLAPRPAGRRRQAVAAVLMGLAVVAALGLALPARAARRGAPALARSASTTLDAAADDLSAHRRRVEEELGVAARSDGPAWCRRLCAALLSLLRGNPVDEVEHAFESLASDPAAPAHLVELFRGQALLLLGRPASMRDASIWLALALAHAGRAAQAAQQGRDPSPAVREARTCVERARALGAATTAYDEALRRLQRIGGHRPRR